MSLVSPLESTAQDDVVPVVKLGLMWQQWILVDVLLQTIAADYLVLC